MAVALEQSQCLVDKDCKKETESLEKLRIYLKIVDNQFVRVDLLKLSLYSEVLWGKLDKCSVPSDVFNSLAEVSENQDTALQKFLFALEVIGGRLRGTHCVEEAKALLKSVPPRLALYEQSRKYRFCQCLVRIAKEFPHGDPDTAQEMKNRLSKLIDCNPRLFEFNSMILVKLLQTQTVTEEDSTVLQRELQTCTEHCRNDDMRRVLNECTALLLDYHDNGKNIVHQLIPPERNSFANSLEQSYERCVGALRRGSRSLRQTLLKVTANRQPRGAELLNDAQENEPNPQEQETQMTSAAQKVPSTEPHTGEPNPQEDAPEQSIVQSGPTTKPHDDPNSQEGVTKWDRVQRQLGTKKKLLIVVTLTLCAVAAVIVPCTVLVWSPLHNTNTHISTRQLMSNTALLAEMDSFFIDRVTVRENVFSRDSVHEIKLYLTEQACHNIPTVSTQFHYSGQKFVNTTPSYMLAGSWIELHTCVGYTVGSQGRNKSQIELYLVNGADDSEFDPYKTISHTIEIGKDGEIKCTNIMKNIHTSGYYYLVFLLPSTHHLNISFEMDREILSVNITALNESHIGDLTFDQDSVSVSLDHWRHKYCLVGDVHGYETTRPFVHVEVMFSLNYTKTLGLSLGLTLPMIVLWISLVMYCVLKPRNKQTL